MMFFILYFCLKLFKYIYMLQLCDKVYAKVNVTFVLSIVSLIVI